MSFITKDEQLYYVLSDGNEDVISLIDQKFIYNKYVVVNNNEIDLNKSYSETYSNLFDAIHDCIKNNGSYVIKLESLVYNLENKEVFIPAAIK